MKRILLTLSFIVFAITNVLAANYNFSAVCSSGQTLYYKITNNSEPYTVSVTYAEYYCYYNSYGSNRYYYYYNHPQPGGDIIIPESVVYNGVEYSVTGIDAYAFCGCEYIKSIVIPNTVTDIGGQAFKDYRDLSFVVIPNSITRIYANTFSRMDGYNAYPTFYCEPSTNPGWDENWNSNIGQIFWNIFIKDDFIFQIHDNIVFVLKYLGENQTLSIPSTVTYDGSEYTVTSIYSYAFQNCSITTITIPNSVTDIYGNAFYGCDNIETLTYNTNAVGAQFSGKTSLKNVSIGGSVTEISNDAFSGCSGLTSITIPETVTSIGSNAFNSCSSLTSLTIPNSVTYIGSNAFDGCSGLISISLPNDITKIESSTFQNCSSLTSINIPNTVSSIGSSAFYGCNGLTSFSLPNGITKIEPSTFQNCSSLTSINIPNTISSIGSSAFYGCSGLTSFSLPNGITKIESSTFQNCSSLTSIAISDNVTFIGESAFADCTGLTSVSLPNTITSVGGQAFKNCINLTSFTFPESVTFGGNSILAGCNKLDSLEIPCSYCNRNLGKYLFGAPQYENNASYVPQSLKTVVIKGNCTSIEDYTFCGWGGVNSITIPGSVTGFGVNNFSTFSGCAIHKVDYGNIENLIHSGLGSILTNSYGSWSLYCNGEEIVDLVIPDGVTSIDYKAFFKCVNLKSVTIPNSVTEIGGYAFSECSGLTLVTIPESVTTIRQNAFNNSNITFICEAQSKPGGWRTGWENGSIADWNTKMGTIYWGVSFIEGAFAYKIVEGSTVSVVKYLGDSESVEIPSKVAHNNVEYTVVEIGNTAFQSNATIKSVTIPTTIATIGNSAFSGCGLESINIPNSVTVIGASAFENCSKLKSVNISASVESIGGSAFANCAAIETLTFNTNAIGTHFSDKQKLATINIGSNVTTIPASAFSGCVGLEQIAIPANVKSIADNAFKDCSNLESITIGNSVEAIGNSAFSGCSSLVSVSIPNSVETIGNTAFNGCSSLVSITLPNAITTIDYNTFGGCGKLQTINIPRSVTTIGAGAFGSTGLTSVSIPNQVETIGSYAFGNCSHLKTVNIPASVSSIGSDAFVDCDSIQTLSFNTKAIGSHFNGKTLLTSITIGSNVTEIPASAFGSTGLTMVDIPENIETIGAGAFLYCSHLKSVNIPSSVETIGGSAFAGCDSIKTLSFNTDAVGTHFSGKQNLLSVDIGEAVTTLADNAFSGCGKLPAIVIPNTVTNVGASAFDDCSSLTIYCMCTETYGRNNWNSNWNPDNRPVSWQIIISDDFYYQTINSANIAVVKYRGSKLSVSIPSNPTINGRICNVVGIAENAFANNDNLKQIVIPNSIKTIGEYAFSGCANLESVVIGNGVTAIGEAAFSDCNKVESFKIGCTTPPTITETTLEISGWATIYVPCNAESTYSTAAVWCDYYYEETQSYILAVSSENEHKGTAKVKQQPTCEGAAVIEATANAGYSFSSWSDGNTANPRTLTVNNDIMLTALFEVDINVAITSSDAERGYVENITPIYEFDYNAPLTVKAVPNYGYYFICWNDDVTDNPRTITLNQEVAIQAIFGVNQYQLTLGVNNATMGSIVDASGVYYYKDNVSTSATANYGYHFVKWSDGETEKSRTITIAKDTVIKAEFAINQYAITLQANVAERGSVSGAGSFNYLANKQIAATANYGYVFEKWSDGITTNPRTIALSQDTAFTAVFVLDKFNLQVTSGNAELGSVAGGKTAEYKEAAEISATATAAHYHFNGWTDGNRQNPRTVQVISDTAFVATFAIDSFKITATSRAEEFGSVSGGGLYAYGTAVEVKALPQPHCHFVEWSNDASGMVQMFNVEKDTAIAAVFAIDSHRLQVASADSTMGTATGSGVYDYGTQVVLTATPAANCNFVSWSDGSTTNPRTLTLVSDTAVVANFTLMAEYEVRALPSAAERGTVSGSGSYRVGTEVKLLATANEHYLFNQWSDGHTENPRTVRVIADATYTAVFVPEQYSVTLSQNNADMGMVSGSGIYSYGDVVSCLAKPYQNYHFVQWSNGETANPYEFVIEGNQLLTAYFAAGAVTAIDDDAAAEPIIYAVGKTVVVENAESEIFVYDAMGKLICRDAINRVRAELQVNTAGVYIVKVGNVVKRVMVN